MFSRKTHKKKRELKRLYREQVLDEQLDRLGRKALRRAALSDAETQEVASAPFLYTRLRARIAAEKERIGDGWLAILFTARQLVTVMALVAVAALVIWLSVVTFMTNGRAPSGGDSLVANDSQFERIVFADNASVSDSDVLATITYQDEDENQK